MGVGHVDWTGALMRVGCIWMFGVRWVYAFDYWYENLRVWNKSEREKWF